MNSLNHVTEWSHPHWDTSLIIADSPTKSRSVAEQYVGEGSMDDLTFTEKEMTNAELAALPEFDG